MLVAPEEVTEKEETLSLGPKEDIKEILVPLSRGGEMLSHHLQGGWEGTIIRVLLRKPHRISRAM